MNRSCALLAAALLLTAPLAAQSLWNPRRPSPSLTSDTIARLRGDVLTIIISENQRILNQERSQFTKELDLEAALTDFMVLPNAFEPLPSVTGSSNREFTGDGRYDKQGSFNTRLSVMVIDVHPNGNLIVEGRRQVVMDKETKTMRITGVVRPFDILSDNTVRSERVANASIAYEGDGPLTVATNRGWLSGLLDFVWPF